MLAGEVMEVESEGLPDSLHLIVLKSYYHFVVKNGKPRTK